MTLNDLTVDFKHLDRTALLADWRWLLGKNKVPIMLSASGDAFLQDIGTGEIHVLDVAANQVELVAGTLDEFQTQLNDHAFVGKYFAVQRVDDLRKSGLQLPFGKIYSFIHPPWLGGAYILGNIEVSDIEVHFSMTGQLGQQTARLANGATISSMSTLRAASHKPWWNVW